MRKIGCIAAREFVATVLTRGFIIGLLVMPATITLLVIAFPRLLSQRSFRTQGQIAIIDPTGAVAPELRAAVDPAAIAARRKADARGTLAQAPPALREIARGSSEEALDAALGQIPDLRIVERPAGADVQREKEWLLEEVPRADRHLALAVIHPDAVASAARGEYGGYDLYVPLNFDNRIDTVIQQSLRQAIVAARARAQNVDRDQIDQLIRVDRASPVAVTRSGDRRSFGTLNFVLPFAFAFFLFFGIMMGGQTLMTSTVEEKSSRVVEVLLSAVSPLELMAGKILGQMAVSAVALSLYIVMGAALLVAFAVVGLVNLGLLGYLAVFFVIAYLVVGSLMVAIGAAVNEMKEAQSLMAPIMLVMIVPMVLAQALAQDPNSMMATVLSFVPPINSFVMLIRLASTTPPPFWQVGLSIAIGLGSVLGAVWVAAKIFRIGLLMYGKPPDLATLVRWVRAA